MEEWCIRILRANVAAEMELGCRPEGSVARQEEQRFDEGSPAGMGQRWTRAAMEVSLSGDRNTRAGTRPTIFIERVERIRWGRAALCAESRRSSVTSDGVIELGDRAPRYFRAIGVLLGRAQSRTTPPDSSQSQN